MSESENRHVPQQIPESSERTQEETWLDFLRSAGRTIAPSSVTPRQQVTDEFQRPPTHRTESQDRKRRLTTAPEPDRRGHYYHHRGEHCYHQRSFHGRIAMPEHGGMNEAGAVRDGGSLGTAIDLSSPPRAPRNEGPIRRVTEESRREDESSRRGSDQLPRWQPDHEVTKCPVCGNVFNFWTRRHHCR